MKILFLSFYFAPDLCAGSFRSNALIDKLKEYDVEIVIVTTKPNRYSDFSVEAEDFEQQDNVTIHRVQLPNHNSGMFDQVRAFLKYYKKTIDITKNQDYDMVFATSSRLFTAFLGSRVSRKKNIPLYLDIRDIFVDTIKDVLPRKLAWFFKPIFSFVEGYSFKRARHINLVSKGFRDYFEYRYPDVNYSWFTNGIDDSFLEASWDYKKVKKDILNIVYAGNIGEGQGLHRIIPELAIKLAGKAKIKIIGSGGRLAQLEEVTKSLTNVKICKPVERSKLIEEYQQADVLFLHLNAYPAFEKVLPSKVFEYAATGKPILAGVAGYSAGYIKNRISNARVFYPTDASMACEELEKLSLMPIDRSAFNTKYSRAVIMQSMARDIHEFSLREC
ncbi:glycosyltransferase family 4 protein [Vibrio sp. 404]|uniref:Glycosyltransferase family 4 protein n=1 Tax=Vibrio marinisediminis TaxID=2758441 RepID=A0A7W2FR76_9VIBR|nr:glycosyltransferase family 4 protein [Vibrio marinisediminis]MBA5762791.1 glycosyltransferase family 4 protein [Vibrio marinisediminis]